MKLKKSELRQMIREALKDDHGGWAQLVDQSKTLSDIAKTFSTVVSKQQAKDFKRNEKEFNRWLDKMESLLSDIKSSKDDFLKRDKAFQNLVK